VSSKRVGCIRTAAGAEPRPLSSEEAGALFTVLQSTGGEIAFGYLFEGCECRAQLLIEHLEGWGVEAGRVGAVSVGRPLTVPHPTQPRAVLRWHNHVAPFVAVEGAENGMLVLDPSLTQTGPLTLSAWAAGMRARAVEGSTEPLSQVEILSRQAARALQGQELDAIHFALGQGEAPIPELGGSGFRLTSDPPEGPSAFARAEMQRLLALQRRMRPDYP